MPAYYLDLAMMGGGVCLPTYTGNMQIVKVATGKYYARLKSNGVLTFPTEMLLDVFLTGGGGGGGGTYNRDQGYGGDIAQLFAGPGGGGGYTTNKYGVLVKSTSVSIGAGGAGGPFYWKNFTSSGGSTEGGQRGGITKFGSYSAEGGYGGLSTTPTGADGGSGGGVAHSSYWNRKKYIDGFGSSGGSNGNNALAPGTNSQFTIAYAPGKGQGTTTRPFGGSSPFQSTYYSGGGGGGGSQFYSYSGGNGGGGNGGWYDYNVNYPAKNGAPNTGGGGGGARRGGVGNGIQDYCEYGGSGGSGIVIIRWPSQKWK